MQIQHRFGAHLRLLRKRAGLTQAQLAQHVGLSAESISNIERGTYAPAFNRLEAIAQALNVEVHELFRWAVSDQNE